ncbi:L-histidine N(alpha)-methyltransferase [Nannocystis pusilla]|uniref:L-histidine N(alpha)-methyltransferase n=1 Tax=Nannocystis pusilla TaxID=889268 RepID=UPI003DA2EB89
MMRPVQLRTLDEATQAPTDGFLADVIEGLSRPAKRLPSKYFYDARGSRLFEAICETPEYYLTRAEIEILGDHAMEMAAAVGPRRIIVEYGSGESIKTRLLLDHLDATAYVPVDVSREPLLAASAAIQTEYPKLKVLPLHADFTRPFSLPVGALGRSLVYFPGSTIGNFEPAEATALLRNIARAPGCEGALVGIDLVKSKRVLEAAYNDSDLVTAAFNLNLLHRINSELGGEFQPGRFSHRAVYNEAAGRIEMYLVSKIDQVVGVGGRSFSFRAHEAILTELSHKYTLDGFSDMSSSAGLTLTQAWTDDAARFAVVHLVRRAA